MREKYGGYPMSGGVYREPPKWQDWQVAMLIESYRVNIPLWVIAEEFSFTMGDIVNKLEWLKWKGKA